MTNANPSVDPANLDSLTGAFREIFKKLMQGIDGMLPATIIGFDRGPPPRVQVQPEIMMVTTAGDILPRAQIASIPVLQFGGGGFVLSFNLKPGDKGWILASDRDISNFLQSQSSAAPNTFRMKNFADSLFIPDVMINYTLAEEDAQNAVLQSLDGTVKISLGINKITYTAPLHVFNGPVQFNDIVNADAGLNATGGGANSLVLNGNQKINGSQTITGNQRVDGNITAGGSITPDVP